MYTHREGLTRLILRNDDVERPTLRKDCGAREAVSRGFAEYLQQLSHVGQGGRPIAFVQVKATYGDLWTPTQAEVPAANIHGGVGDAEYDASRTSGSPIECDPGADESDEVGCTTDRGADGLRLPPNFRRAWFSPSTFEVQLGLEVWAQDLGQRMMLEHMLEDDFNPTPDWLGGGFRLELPHYCNARADYHVAGSSISYEGRQAQQSKYLSKYVVQAKLELRVSRAFPRLVPIIDTEVNGGRERVIVPGSDG